MLSRAVVLGSMLPTAYYWLRSSSKAAADVPPIDSDVPLIFIHGLKVHACTSSISRQCRPSHRREGASGLPPRRAPRRRLQPRSRRHRCRHHCRCSRRVRGTSETCWYRGSGGAHDRGREPPRRHAALPDAGAGAGLLAPAAAAAAAVALRHPGPRRPPRMSLAPCHLWYRSPRPTCC